MLWFRLVSMVLLLVVFDLYAYQAVKTLTTGLSWGGYIRLTFWVLHIAFYLIVWGSFAFFYSKFNIPRPSQYYLFTVGVILYLPKLFILAPLLIEDISRAGRWAFFKAVTPTDGIPDLGRRKFVSMTGVLLAGIPFVGLAYGAIRGKYAWKVFREDIRIPGLPDAWNGFTITQLSDIHTGSLDNMNAVEEGIQLANAQRSDVIVFTGDLVNNRSEEALPFEKLLSSLNAPLGVFSVLGNHDYADYTYEFTPEQRIENRKILWDLQQRMGWKLLKNEHVILERDGACLAIAGVENWGRNMNFPRYGKLDQALDGTESADVRILLSHDPSHWEAEVQKHSTHVHLTLSGHTHGMQMGVELPFFRFSPSQWVYKQWAGLYAAKDRHLYVNRGFGFLGYSGRAGISPEITVLTLRKA